MEPLPVHVLGLDDQVEVRVGLIRVQHHGISVPDPEFLAGEHPGGRQHLFRRGRRGHRQDDVVDQLRLARVFALIMRPPILPGGQFEVPAGKERPLRVLPGNRLPVVRLDLELPLPADVREMRRDGAGLRSATRDLHHDFRSPPHRPPDLLDLRWAEAGSGRSPSAEAGQL